MQNGNSWFGDIKQIHCRYISNIEVKTLSKTPKIQRRYQAHSNYISHCTKRCVFNRVLKDSVEFACLTMSGKLFHSSAEAYLKVRDP